ncbi:MAG: HTH domain-containing protein [Eubacterium sp.]
MDELALLQLISKNPSITQIQLAEKMQVTDRTIKRKMKLLQEKGLIQRVNGKRNGYWKIMGEL